MVRSFVELKKQTSDDVVSFLRRMSVEYNTWPRDSCLANATMVYEMRYNKVPNPRPSNPPDVLP